MDYVNVHVRCYNGWLYSVLEYVHAVYACIWNMAMCIVFNSFQDLCMYIIIDTVMCIMCSLIQSQSPYHYESILMHVHMYCRTKF